MTENKKKVDWISLIIGIFFIFIAFIAFKNPLASLESLVAIWFIIDSINDLIYGSYLKDIHGGLYGLNIAINIISIILGIMMIYNPLGTAFTVVYLIGMYFIISGVKYIVHAFEYQY